MMCAPDGSRGSRLAGSTRAQVRSGALEDGEKAELRREQEFEGDVEELEDLDVWKRGEVKGSVHALQVDIEE